MPSATMPIMHGMTTAYLLSGNGKSGKYSGSTNGCNLEQCVFSIRKYKQLQKMPIYATHQNNHPQRVVDTEHKHESTKAIAEHAFRAHLENISSFTYVYKRNF